MVVKKNQRASSVSSLAEGIWCSNANRMLSISFPRQGTVVAGTNSLSDGKAFDPMLVRFRDQEDFTILQ